MTITADTETAAGMEPQCCTTILCPGCQLRYRGTQLWMTDDQAGTGRYADTSHRTPQDSRDGSWTPKFGTAHSSRCQPHTCLFLHTGCYTSYCIWTLEKVPNTPHSTELTSEKCHYSWLRV